MKKAAFTGLGVVISTILIIGVLLIMSMFVDAISLQSIISVRDAETQSVCTNVLENLVGSDYAKTGGSPDTFLKKTYQQEFNTSASYFAFQEDLERNPEFEENAGIHVRFGSSSELKNIIQEEANQDYSLQCFIKVYSPSGEPTIVMMFRKQGLSFGGVGQ